MARRRRANDGAPIPIDGQTLSNDQQELLKNVPQDGTSIGNKALRNILNWPDQDRYWRVRNSLASIGVLRLGRGKGGSVARIDIAGTSDTVTSANGNNGPRVSEASLYDPLEKASKEKWTKDENPHKFQTQIIARQGRRATGGTWTRPDIVVVSVKTYSNLPGKFVDVITFEVKTAEGLDITAVYEALSHLRAATQAFLIVSMSAQERNVKAELVESVADEARRHGIGFIIVPDVPRNYNDWEFLVEATAVRGDPSAINDFLESQLHHQNKVWLRQEVR